MNRDSEQYHTEDHKDAPSKSMPIMLELTMMETRQQKLLEHVKMSSGVENANNPDTEKGHESQPGRGKSLMGQAKESIKILQVCQLKDL